MQINFGYAAITRFAGNNNDKEDKSVDSPNDVIESVGAMLIPELRSERWRHSTVPMIHRPLVPDNKPLDPLNARIRKLIEKHSAIKENRS